MRKSCRYCGRTHDTSETCPLAPPKWERRNKNTQASKFRSTNAWTQKAERIKERDHYLCRVCMAERGDIERSELFELAKARMF